jgi:hypothetical protein
VRYRRGSPISTILALSRYGVDRGSLASAFTSTLALLARHPNRRSHPKKNLYLWRVLKRCRHGIFHFQKQYFDDRFMSGNAGRPPFHTVGHRLDHSLGALRRKRN